MNRQMRSDRPKPEMISASFINSPYHCVEKPLHTMSWRELLNENTTSTMMGR
jgi:hypothetical protein